MIHVVIEEPFQDRLDWSFLVNSAEETLRHEGASDQTDLTIVIDSDDKLHQLNREFLEIDAPTDVLSFPSDEIDPESGKAYLGDVIISYTRAAAQAEAAGHAPESEIQLLVVHGVLHLLGYDHSSDAEKAAMWAAQKEVLGRLGSRLAKFPD
jgi:probable rRNA maturation factor